MADKISVIVPIYNTEKYLEECIESLLSQSYTELQIILVDDGSKDGSGAICDRFAGTDNRITVIHKENGGLSSARNAGLKAADGEYIAFIDSDDKVDKDYFSLLFAAVNKEEKISFSFCDCTWTRCPKLKKTYDEELLLQDGEFGKWLKNPDSREYVLAVIACNKLYRRRFIDGLQFPMGRWHEDEFFTNDVLKRVEKCIFVPKELYYYRENEQSITGSANRLNKRHLDTFDAYTVRIVDSINRNDKVLATSTAEYGLVKLQKYIREIGNGEDTDKELKSTFKKKYREFYFANKKALGTKKKLKGLLFMVFPKFVKIK